MARALSIVSSSQGTPSCSAAPALSVQNGYNIVPASEFRGRAAVITLGCAKNQVDSEVMLGVLQSSGFEITNEIERADVAIINTCGFLESSVKESIDCVLEVAEHKRSGQLKKLIMAGCAVERYKGDIRAALPEVDDFLAIDDVLRVGEAALGAVKHTLSEGARPYFIYDDSMPRYLSTQPHFAYIKISEGCNRPCTFCIIPRIRGEMRSRSADSLLREFEALGSRGVREVNLVAQDLTSYGVDHKGPDLSELLTRFDRSGAVDWVRLLYAYPIGTDQRLLETISALPHVCDYLDIPLQHVSEKVLKRMQRPLGRYSPRAISELVAKHAPQITLRTTFIVGFPGETEDDVAELEDFICAGHFGSVGVFTYSQESGTPAGEMPDQIAEEEKRSRRERLMLAQQRVVERRQREMLGKQIEVLVEGTHEDTDLLFSARSRCQAPEVDGAVIINDLRVAPEKVRGGVMAQVEITDFSGYDLIGTLVGVESVSTPR